MTAAPVDWGAVYRRAPDIVFREIAGEAILVPIRGNLADMQRIYTLTATGAFIWRRLDGAAPLGSIREAVLSEFDVGPEEAESSITTFMDDLVASGLAGRAG